MASVRIKIEGVVNRARQWRCTFVGLTPDLKAASPATKRRIEQVIVEELRKASPVRTGKLRRGWRARILGGRGRLRNLVVYALYQDVDTINRGYVRRGCLAAYPRIEDLLDDE